MDIRLLCTELALRRFGYKGRTCKDIPAASADWNEKEVQKWWVNEKKQRDMAEGFDNWFIDDERNIISAHCRNLVEALIPIEARRGSIEPRKGLTKKALNTCDCLEKELEYISDTIPTNLNLFTSIVDKIETAKEHILTIQL